MTDTTIRHVTPAGYNLFAELGFDSAEAAALKAQADAETLQTLALKQQLMAELRDWIAQEGLKQAQAAEILGVSRPRVSDVVRGQVGKFTLDALVGMLSQAGRQVRLVVG